MLFFVKMTVKIPPGLDPAEAEEIEKREHARAADLQEQGKWLHLWRIVGQFSNISVFKVESPAEMHEILGSLPFRPFMEVELTALCQHPGALAKEE